MPALVDRVNVLLFEGEKVQMKVVQTHQDAMQQKVQVEGLLQDSVEAVAQADEMITKFQQSAYENEQQHAQMMFNLAKQRRIEEDMARSRHGYLTCKTVRAARACTAHPRLAPCTAPCPVRHAARAAHERAVRRRSIGAGLVGARVREVEEGDRPRA